MSHSNPLQRKARLGQDGQGQTLSIPKEFTLRGDEAWISREGERLIVEPAVTSSPLAALLTRWCETPPLGPEDALPAIEDEPLRPADLF